MLATTFLFCFSLVYLTSCASNNWFAVGVCGYPKLRVPDCSGRAYTKAGSPTISDRVGKSSRVIGLELDIIRIKFYSNTVSNEFFEWNFIRITFRINSSNKILFKIFTEIIQRKRVGSTFSFNFGLFNKFALLLTLWLLNLSRGHFDPHEYPTNTYLYILIGLSERLTDIAPTQWQTPDSYRNM